jgi:hypothetical protein
LCEIIGKQPAQYLRLLPDAHELSAYICPHRPTGDGAELLQHTELLHADVAQRRVFLYACDDGAGQVGLYRGFIVEQIDAAALVGGLVDEPDFPAQARGIGNRLRRRCERLA